MNDHCTHIAFTEFGLWSNLKIIDMIEPKWKYKFVDKKNVADVAKLFSLPNSIAHIMSLKGINSRNLSRDFFYPDINSIHNPFLLKDMDKAVERIL